jgi:hypothetical protein
MFRRFLISAAGREQGALVLIRCEQVSKIRKS